ncbi:MAG TPA: SMI1/KNR4 family protein [Nitriliruptorales bacterium]
MDADALRTRIDAAVTELETIDGVRTWPGATDLQIAQAERELAVRFPADFRTLLRRTNGLELCHGRLRLFGVGPAAPLDLVGFNHPDTWRWAWPDRPDLDDLVWVGMNDVPSATAYRRSGLGRRPQGSVQMHAGPIDLPGYLTSQQVLVEALEGPWQKMAASPFATPSLAQFVRAFGRIPMDKAVVPGPARFFPPYDELREHEGAFVGDIAYAMSAYADLLHSADQILEQAGDDPVAIVGAEPWVDEAGRARIRWVAGPVDTDAPADVP